MKYHNMVQVNFDSPSATVFNYSLEEAYIKNVTWTKYSNIDSDEMTIETKASPRVLNRPALTNYYDKFIIMTDGKTLAKSGTYNFTNGVSKYNIKHD